MPVKLVILLAVIGSVAAAANDYQSNSATNKQNFLWNKVAEKPYTAATLPTDASFSLKALYAPYLKGAFTNEGDEMEEGRKKVVHPFGIVGKIELEMYANSTYTGVFQAGSKGLGFTRLSWARFDPSQVMPGVALKVLVDGKQSQNFHLMRSLDGQGTDQNFFLNEVGNIYPDPSSFIVRLAAKTFQLGVDLLPGPSSNQPESATLLGLYEQAAVTVDGAAVAKVVAPYKIELRPSADIKAWQVQHTAQSKAAKLTEDFRTVLAAIPEGTVLYDVVLFRNKAATDKGQGDLVGRLTSKSKFIASQFVDEGLYFQHAHKRWQA